MGRMSQQTSPVGKWSRPQPVLRAERRTTNISQNGTKHSHAENSELSTEIKIYVYFFYLKKLRRALQQQYSLVQAEAAAANNNNPLLPSAPRAASIEKEEPLLQ